MEDTREAEARKNRKNVNPYKKANFFSKILFVWVLPLFKYGYSRDLTEDDIFPILKSYDSTILGTKLKKAWNQELKKKKDPSLWKALGLVFWKETALLGLWYFFTETVVKLSQPIALAKLLEYYEANSTMTKKEAWIYSGLVVLFTFFPVLFQHNFMFRQLLLGRKLKIATSALVYEKSLRISKSALADTTIGQMVNLISNDVGRFEQVTKFLQDLWVVPIEISVILILLYFYVGYTGMMGVLVVLAWIPVQSYIGSLTSKYRLRTALRTDERIRLMNEVLSGIQVIKMYTWEKPFAKLVEIARRNEMRQITKISILRATNAAPYLFLSRLAILVCVFANFMDGNILNAKYVFVLSSFYSILQKTMTVRFPQGVMQFAEAGISIRRIKQFLLYQEVDFDNSKMFLNGLDLKISNGNSKKQNGALEKRSNVGIKLKNVSIKWLQSAEEATMEKLNLEIKDKQLVAVIGQVGSGKSTLLHAILKELPPIEGTTQVTGTVSYASQEPWLFVGSVRQNITFGQPFEQERYNQVVRVCALQRDFGLFPYGDKTIVGERGVSLSGGQRARINLARAVYKKADIYLLDDPLSAVDTHVGKHLFEECVDGFLRDKCVVLVTHQLQYLKDVQQIVLLDNGTIEQIGTYDEIQNSGEEFAKLLKARVKQEEEFSDDEDLNDNSKPNDMVRKRSSVKKADKNKDKKDEPHLEKEGRGHGKLDWAVYKSYFASGHGICSIVVLFLSFILTQVLCSSTDYYVSYWVNMIQLAQKIEEGIPLKSTQNSSLIPIVNSNVTASNVLDGNFTNLDQYDLSLVQKFWLENMTEEIILSTYISIIILLIILSLARSMYFYLFCIKAATNLHRNMFDKIVYATMRFFNTNPSGRILNRFSMDMNQVDELLPITLLDTVQNFLMVFAITVVVASINPWMLIPTAIILVIFYFIRVVYLASSRDMKRLEGTTRSPVYTHLTATLHGLTTIRAFGAENILKKEFDHYQNENSSAYFTFMAMGRCFGIWLDMHCVIFVGLVTFSFLLFDTKQFGGNVGLSITQSIALTGLFQWGMRQWSELENNMTCVERIKEYADITPEKDETTKDPPKSWPEKGTIKFENLSLRYAPGEPCVLKDLHFEIQDKEKVGVVGRTGAGKSSIIIALFRLAENQGKIIIDNVDIETISLNKLRSSISIIPQEPVLFSGSMRKNLDPFDEYSDEVLWGALEDVELKSVVQELPGGLESFMSEGGSNFSVGQRQLVCLARAIVRNNRILVLDEATANVDPQTDALIQHTIRDKFSQCTVLTIAHRLHTIMDSDKILVMDAGKVAEFGTPLELLQNNGIFYEMVHQTGRAMAESLTETAKEIAELRRIGGQNYGQVTRRIMYKLLTNDVTIKFSRDGAKKKAKFKSIKVANGILESLKSLYNDISEAISLMSYDCGW